MVNLKDIANEAGVSLSTVSAVMGGREKEIRIGGTTADKVREVAARMGFYPNELARSVRTGKSRVICFLLENLEHSYTLEILKGIMNSCQDNDYTVKIFTFQSDVDFKGTVHKIISQRPAGVICTALEMAKLKFLERLLAKNRIDLAQVDSIHEGITKLAVVSNDKQGAASVVEYLYNLGHRRIAHLTSMKGRRFAAQRYDGYMAKMKELCLPVPEGYVQWIDPRESENLIKVMDLTEPPTAIFCNSDPLAAEVMHELIREGFKIPEDVSVIGYADMEFCQYCTPKLTSVNQGFTEMGKEVAERLIKKLTGERKSQAEQDNHELIEINVELVIRESSGPIP